jgi:hypothetical protein
MITSALYERSNIRLLTMMLCVCAATAAEATSHSQPQPDIRDLAALLLFNGEHGARAFDSTGPIGDDDALWSREAAGRYTFATARPSVTVHGLKSVTVESGCIVRIESRFVWLFAAKPAETLERTEELDFRRPVVADAVLALKEDRPYAVILDMRSSDGFYCAAIRINGADVQPRQCSSGAQPVVAPGREDSPVMEHFRRFSVACRNTKERQ